MCATLGSPCLLVFTREIIIPGFLGWSEMIFVHPQGFFMSPHCRQARQYREFAVVFEHFDIDKNGRLEVGNTQWRNQGQLGVVVIGATHPISDNLKELIIRGMHVLGVFSKHDRLSETLLAPSEHCLYLSLSHYFIK